MKVKVKKLDPRAVLPEYATPGSACFDIHVILDEIGDAVLPGTRETFRTGLAFEIPEGHVMLVHSRSGMGFKHSVVLANGTGVLDSDYRGELRVALQNHGPHAYPVDHGDRVAQAMIIPVDKVEWEEVSELSETERGECGYGSTGK